MDHSKIWTNEGKIRTVLSKYWNRIDNKYIYIYIYIYMIYMKKIIIIIIYKRRRIVFLSLQTIMKNLKEKKV